MGRAGHVGDVLGSSLIGSRLVRDIMRIAFCLERQHPPYPKWFGTAFGRLACAPELGPTLEAAVHAWTWQERQSALCPAYELLIRLQRAAGIDDGVSDNVSPFWSRPFLVIQGDRIAAAVFSCMEDPGLHALARRRPVGNIDLISDSTDVLESTEVGALLRGLYQV
jgi:hypothetical protein